MASLAGTQLKDTYESLLKLSDNDALTLAYKEVTDGEGAGTNLYVGTAGNVGIGGSPSVPLEIIGSASTMLSLNRNSGGSDVSLKFKTNTASPDGTFLNGGGSLALFRFFTESTERLRIKSTGDISFRDTSNNEAFYWDADVARLGIGTSNPSKKLDVTGTSRITGEASFENDILLTNNAYVYSNNGGSGVRAGWFLDGTNQVIKGLTAGSERLRIDSSGNTSIYSGVLNLGSDSVASSLNCIGDVFNIGVDSDGNSGGSPNMRFNVSGSEKMRIDSSGNVLVGKTSADDFSSAGAQIESGGQITTSVAGAPSLRLNRGTDDGDIIEFNRAGSEVGSIGAVDGQLFIGNEAGSVDSGLLFGEAGTTARAIIPSRAEGTVLDNALDLGYASGRFKDLYLGGNAYANGFYQNGSVTDNLVISQGTGTSKPSVGLWGNDHASFPGQVHIVSNSSNADADSGEIRFYDFTGSAFQINMTIDKSGNVDVAGALSKGSGSFKIDHPLESKKDTHYLVHSFVESPQANNIYRGSVDLADGQATVNLDEVSGMTDGTFVLLNTDIHVYTSNESDWDAVKGSVSDNVLTIECQNSSSNAKVNWLVIGERHDQHMIETNWTDENGKVIVEPLKPIENELEN